MTEERLWSSSERTIHLLWVGWEEFLRWYAVFISEHKLLGVGKVTKAGLVRWGNHFYSQVDPLLDKFKDKFKDEEVVRLRDLFEDIDHDFSASDWVFVKKFFSDFMVQTGAANMVIKVDNRSIKEKIDSEFGG